MAELRSQLQSPWHDGERTIQQRLGVGDRMEETGQRVVRPYMPDQHRSFFAQLPFIVVGSNDRAGQIWASLLAGAPGFVRSPDPRRLEIAATASSGDPLAEMLQPGIPLGVLGIELPTRRRNRVNGPIVSADASGFTIAVEQSFGNCPKYIMRRDALVSEVEKPSKVEPLSTLDHEFDQTDQRGRDILCGIFRRSDRRDRCFASWWTTRICRGRCRWRHHRARLCRQSVLQHAWKFPGESASRAHLSGFHDWRYAATDRRHGNCLGGS